LKVIKAIIIIWGFSSANPDLYPQIQKKIESKQINDDQFFFACGAFEFCMK